MNATTITEVARVLRQEGHEHRDLAAVASLGISAARHEARSTRLLELATEIETAVTTGPGTTDDERKALMQLLDAMPTLTPAATGFSHAMRLILLDAMRFQDAKRNGTLTATDHLR